MNSVVLVFNAGASGIKFALYLIEERGMSAREVSDLLYNR